MTRGEQDIQGERRKVRMSFIFQDTPSGTQMDGYGGTSGKLTSADSRQANNTERLPAQAGITEKMAAKHIGINLENY